GVVLGGWWGVGIVSSCHPKGAGICRVLGLKRGPLIVLLGPFGFGVWWVSVLLVVCVLVWFSGLTLCEFLVTW
ncbi:hypothetical protein, partial [Pseudoclavibacter sp. CFCC 13796]|uniref:hypothetical protein n=1 Tax=Pseudoclavibacter sp. CFCC 13796 TaxID=2615179 RepID=UPI001CE3E446